MERYIYYMGQKDWTREDYDYLNSFLVKIFQYRDKPVNEERIRHMNLHAMERKTKAILKAVLSQQGIMDEMTEKYKNLSGVKDIKPLDEPLILSEEPCRLFKEYEDMNIIM